MAHPYASQAKSSLKARLGRLSAKAGKSHGYSSMYKATSYPTKNAGTSRPMTIAGGSKGRPRPDQKISKYAKGGLVGDTDGKYAKGGKVKRGKGSTTNIVIAQPSGGAGPPGAGPPRPIPIPVPIRPPMGAGPPSVPGGPPGVPPPGAAAGPTIINTPPGGGGSPMGMPAGGARPFKRGGSVKRQEGGLLEEEPSEPEGASFRKGGGVKKKSFSSGGSIKRDIGGILDAPSFGGMGTGAPSIGGLSGQSSPGPQGLGGGAPQEGYDDAPPRPGESDLPGTARLTGRRDPRRPFPGMPGGGSLFVAPGRATIGPRTPLRPAPGLSTAYKKGGSIMKGKGFTGKNISSKDPALLGPKHRNQGVGFTKGGSIKRAAGGPASSGKHRLGNIAAARRVPAKTEA